MYSRPGALVSILVIVLASISLVSAAGSALASSTTNVTWQQVNANPPVPPSRDSAAMAYDSADNEMVLFGGEYVTGSGGCYSDTWTFSGGSWTQLTVSPAPTARWGASMVYDAADGYVLLFGGGCNGQGYLGDTWEFHAGHWTELNPSVSPSPRAYAAMTYDAADGYVLLFGGNGQVSVNGQPQNATFDDTWEFRGGVWTQIPITVGSGPSARTYSAMCYDSSYGKVLLFGGEAPGSGNTVTVYSDTWVYSAGSWSQLTSTGPTARAGEQLGYLPSVSGDVLFGGLGFTGGSQVQVLQDTWIFSSGSWSQVTPSNPPGARAFGAFAYDGGTSGLFLFGGLTYTGAQVVDYADAWQINGPAASSPTTFGGLTGTELLLLVVIVVVVVALVVAVVLLRRRKPTVTSPPGSGAVPPVSYGPLAAQPPPPTGPYPSPPGYSPAATPPPAGSSYAPPPPAVVNSGPTSPSAAPPRALFCPRCGAPTAADAAFCPKCGRALPPPSR